MIERRKTFYIRRTIFLLTALVVAVPLLVKVELPTVVSWPARNLYDAVERVPSDKIVVISANLSPGSKGESVPQAAALIRHLAMRHKRFAIWGWAYPAGPELAQSIAEPIAKEYGLIYGVDWVNWGYTTGETGAGQVMRGWAKDIPGTVKEDFFHTPLSKLSFMQNVHSARDIGLLIEITPASTVPTYIRFIYGVYGTPIGYACTGVMVPEAFPYLDSHQLVGMLRGLVGAAEYEELIGHHGDATRRMSSQSFAHLLIIALIILGNVGYFLTRKNGRAAPAAVESASEGPQ